MRALLCCLLLVSLAGCGFQLRGDRQLDTRLGAVWMAHAGAPLLTQAVREQLGLNGVAMASGPAEADTVINLGAERFDSRVIAVDPSTGKVREYQLEYSATFSARRGDGGMLLAPQTLDMVREVTFDETAVLGKLEEESVVRRAMLQDAADSVLRRLEVLALRPASD